MKVILLAEDDFNLRNTIVEILESNDYCVVQCCDGQEAIKYLGAQIPDLVISDIMMPNADGYNVLDFSRNNPASVFVPFIFLTAKTECLDLQKNFECGAVKYLSKPFRIKELIAAVEIQLSNNNKVGDKFIGLV